MPNSAHGHHDARRSCWPKSDVPATPPERAGLRPRGIAATDSALTRSFRITLCPPEAPIPGSAVGSSPRGERICGHTPVPSVHSKMKPDRTENETPQMDYSDESNPTPSERLPLSRDNVENDGRHGKTHVADDWSPTSCWPRHDPTFVTANWLSAPPGLTLPTRSRPDYWRNDLLYPGGDSERHGPKTRTSFRNTRYTGTGRAAHHCATL